MYDRVAALGGERFAVGKGAGETLLHGDVRRQKPDRIDNNADGALGSLREGRLETLLDLVAAVELCAVAERHPCVRPEERRHAVGLMSVELLHKCRNALPYLLLVSGNRRLSWGTGLLGAAAGCPQQDREQRKRQGCEERANHRTAPEDLGRRITRQREKSNSTAGNGINEYPQSNTQRLGMHVAGSRTKDARQR